MSPASAILSKNFFDFFAEKFARIEISIYICTPKGEGNAEIAQLVEHNLAKVGVASSSLVFRSRKKDDQMVILFSCVCGRYCSYSCQLLICSSDKPFSQKASMKADARRAFVMSGVLWSMAARRMR